MAGVSVILPCLNEEESIGASIEKILAVFKKNGIEGEVVVVDNGSTDNSAAIAKRFPVTYVFEPRHGYGMAYLAGFKRTTGQSIILGDPDSSYDFNDIPRFLSTLETCDVVLGSRFTGTMEKNAMPFLHRRVGNPLLRFLLRLLYGLRVSEPSTGFLAIRRDALALLDLKEPGMEFSSEMLVRIKKGDFRLVEIPITYHRRTGTSKLRTWRDGFRHLRFLFKERLRA
ncbi:MAG: Glycosyl transferase family 2 [Parcubacteria group bacterium GW2011_GWA2_47_7]|nr:MAG: Glycosyl transferase family 2 [Parcubacteria group bacterium GW2011_GWA2_47_7]